MKLICDGEFSGFSFSGDAGKLFFEEISYTIHERLQASASDEPPYFEKNWKKIFQ